MDYTELKVWQEARKLVKTIYQTTRNFPREEMYGLTNQINRAVVSVPSNIAEGCGRQYSKETVQFLYISRGSLYELETQIYLAFDLEFISKEQLEKILDETTVCKKLINGFIKYYKNKK